MTLGSSTAPAVILFDVNETLSDMSPLAEKFADVGAPGLAKLWFASLLRDGFALTASGDNPAFRDVGEDVLRGVLRGEALTRDLEAAVGHIMAGMTALGVHPDVPAGIGSLRTAGFRLATLSNGAASIAGSLFESAGIRAEFERLLSVADAPAWKPAAAAYEYAAAECGVPARELLLVAVHPWDIHGAARAGLGTAWLNRTGADYPAHFQPPDLTVPALTELAAALGR